VGIAHDSDGTVPSCPETQLPPGADTLCGWKVKAGPAGCAMWCEYVKEGVSDQASSYSNAKKQPPRRNV